MIKKLGYTMIELLISTAIISIIVPSLFALLFLGFRIQIKSRIINQVKREGDFAMNSMVHTIRNFARGTSISCGTTSRDMITDSISFVDKNDRSVTFIYKIENNESVDLIASSSVRFGIASSSFITTETTNITDFSLLCINSSTNGNPIITISFTITSVIDPSLSLTYRNKVMLRSI